MKLSIYQVDAFADEVFKGNPAAVCPLEEWLADDLMQQIAEENNLSETAFFVGEDDGYRLRWFTPAMEVDLCGHATLASAYVLFNELEFDDDLIRFRSNSGLLSVRKDEQRLSMDFPTAKLRPSKAPENLIDALGISAIDVFRDTDYLCVLETEAQVRELEPDLRLLKQVDTRGVIVTAPGKEVDFVSRFFAPAAGVDEDPVTGSAHTMLAPYWSKRLNKRELIGQQVSRRGGKVYCSLKDDRVEIAGEARLYMRGEIEV